eukprot:COSAG01_NODE_2296_length_7966_cov_270.955765_3_plen_112_part_00
MPASNLINRSKPAWLHRAILTVFSIPPRPPAAARPPKRRSRPGQASLPPRAPSAGMDEPDAALLGLCGGSRRLLSLLGKHDIRTVEELAASNVDSHTLVQLGGYDPDGSGA